MTLSPPVSRGPGGVPIYGSGPVWVAVKGDGGSRLFDAAEAVSRAFKGLPGRKAIVAITDGKENGSLRTLNQATQAALESDVIVYGIHCDASPSISGMGTLKGLSDPTGGRTFDVEKDMLLGTIVSEIEDEIRNQYALGYYPPEDVKSGKPHKVQIKVTKPGLVVRSRTSYYR